MRGTSFIMHTSLAFPLLYLTFLQGLLNHCALGIEHIIPPPAMCDRHSPPSSPGVRDGGEQSSSAFEWRVGGTTRPRRTDLTVHEVEALLSDQHAVPIGLQGRAPPQTGLPGDPRVRLRVIFCTRENNESIRERVKSSRLHCI